MQLKINQRLAETEWSEGDKRKFLFIVLFKERTDETSLPELFRSYCTKGKFRYAQWQNELLCECDLRKQPSYFNSQTFEKIWNPNLQA